MVDAVDVPWLVTLQGPILLAVFFYMNRTNENPGSIGLVGQDWTKMLAVGGAVSVVFLTLSGFVATTIGGGFAGFSANLAYTLVFFAIVGFGEEMVWRATFRQS